MGIESIIPNRWSIVPGRETVTYYSAAAGGTWAASVSVTDCEKRSINAEAQAAAGISLNHQACIFHIWNVNITATPAIDDKLTDADSVTWHVRRVDHELLENRYRLTCVKEHA